MSRPWDVSLVSRTLFDEDEQGPSEISHGLLLASSRFLPIV